MLDLRWVVTSQLSRAQASAAVLQERATRLDASRAAASRALAEARRQLRNGRRELVHAQREARYYSRRLAAVVAREAREAATAAAEAATPTPSAPLLQQVRDSTVGHTRSPRQSLAQARALSPPVRWRIAGEPQVNAARPRHPGPPVLAAHQTGGARSACNIAQTTALVVIARGAATGLGGTFAEGLCAASALSRDLPPAVIPVRRIADVLELARPRRIGWGLHGKHWPGSRAALG